MNCTKGLNDTIVFSPHLDDAVFSLGAGLYNHAFGFSKVINIYTKSRYTIDSIKEEYSITSQRLYEDRITMTALGLDSEYWGFKDSSLKTYLYPNEDSYLDPYANIHDDESWEYVSLKIKKLIKDNPNSFFLSPVGMGNHIEHRIISNICRSCIGFADILFYEDATYYVDKDQALRMLAGSPVNTCVVLLNDNFQEKKKFLEFYESQINEQVLMNIEKMFTITGGESLWGKRSTVERFCNYLSSRTVRHSVNVYSI